MRATGMLGSAAGLTEGKMPVPGVASWGPGGNE